MSNITLINQVSENKVNAFLYIITRKRSQLLCCFNIIIDFHFALPQYRSSNSQRYWVNALFVTYV